MFERSYFYIFVTGLIDNSVNVFSIDGRVLLSFRFNGLQIVESLHYWIK